MENRFFCAKENGKLNYKHTMITGFGFMATSIAWAIYDPFITKILDKLLTDWPWLTSLTEEIMKSEGFFTDLLRALSESQQGEITLGAGFSLVPIFIGIIMTFDNIFGVIFQPTFGKLSDRCHSKLGKRRPFIVYGAPVSALLFLIIPIVFQNFGGTNLGVPLTMISVILFVFSMSLWRAPVVALMPDLTPPSLRSEGNAVINLMGGIGSAVGFVAGTIGIALCTLLTPYTKEQIESNEFLSFPYVFAVGSIVMLIGMLIVLFFVKEPDSRIKLVMKGEQNKALDEAARKKAEKEAKLAEKAARKATVLSKGEKKSLTFMLACLFFLFCGTNAITTFFSLFAQEILHMITSKAGFLMIIFAVCSGAAALPAGKLGKKFGRKKTIIAGLAIFLSAFVVFFGIFIALLGAQNLSIKNYVTTNTAYITVNDYINDYNAENKDVAEGTVLTMNGYIDYLNGKDVEFAEHYAIVDAEIQAVEIDNGETKTTLVNEIMKVSETVLKKQTASFANALSNINLAVEDITNVLGFLIYPVLVLGGAANMFITVNTLPLVLEIGGLDKVGTFTGYYYTATFSAQIASPIVYGLIRSFAGTYMSLFYYSPIMFALSLLSILVVKHGEAIPDDVVKAIKEEND